MRRPTAAFSFMILALAASKAGAESGLTAGGTLRRPVSARGIALAEAFTAVEGGLDSLTYNPAGVGGMKRRELKSVYNHGIIDDHFAYLGYAHPWPKLVLTIGAMYYDAGTIALNLSNGVQEKRKVAQDYVGMIGAAAPLAAGVTVGATAKYYRFNLAQEATATGIAADGGAHWKTPVKGLSAGAAVQNMGPDVKFEQEGDPLPLTMRAGVAYLLNLRGLESLKDSSISFDHFLFTAEAIKIRDEKIAAATGIEMRLPFGHDGHGALRFGYMFNRTIDAFSLGVGFKEGRFVVDYALGVKKVFNRSHHFTLGILF